MGLEVGSVAPLEPVLDAIPAAVVLVEPGSGRVLYANPAAHRLAGGRFPLINGADDYADRPLRCAEDGHPLSPDEHPGLRAARGERFRNVALDWDLPGGRRSIVVSGDSLALEGGGQVALLSFEDVTELQAARRRAALLADAGPLLVGSLDPEELAHRVAQLVVP